LQRRSEVADHKYGTLKGEFKVDIGAENKIMKCSVCDVVKFEVAECEEKKIHELLEFVDFC